MILFGFCPNDLRLYKKTPESENGKSEPTENKTVETNNKKKEWMLDKRVDFIEWLLNYCKEYKVET